MPLPSSTSSRPTPALNRILFLLALSVFINYIDRSNLSLAAPMLRSELGLSPGQLGILLSAFFWTYATTPLLSGWLVDRFEVKWILAGGFFLWTSATIVTGLLHTFIALLAARIVLGIGESVAYPAYSKIMGSHFAESSRGTANSAISVGQALGPMVGLLFGAPVIGFFGWRVFFLGLGVLSLLWLIPWFAWMPPTPPPPGGAEKISILAIVKQRSALGTCLTLFCMNYYSYFMLTWLPYYLLEERHFSLSRMSTVAAGMFLCAATASAIFGRLSDRWVAQGGTPTRVRKGVMASSTAFTGVMVAGAAFAPDLIATVLLLFAGAGFGTTASNTWAITQRLAGPRAVGRWTGLQLFVGNLAGVVAPALTGFIVQRTGHFYGPFLVVAVISWIGSLAWIYAIGPLEPVSWQ